MVKRALYIFIPFIIVMLAIIINNNLGDNAIFVNSNVNYLYQNGEDYNIFFLNVEEMNITTKNIKEYFGSKTDIISITPYINPIYKNKLQSTLKYNFRSGGIDSNIANFIEYYDKSIRESGYIHNLETIGYQGVKINEICLYERNINIYNLIKNNPKIKFKNNPSGIYQGI